MSSNVDSISVARAISAYAAQAREALPDDTNVCSYAGIWLLLATFAPAVTGERRTALEAVLGLPCDEAAAAAATLVADSTWGPMSDAHRSAISQIGDDAIAHFESRHEESRPKITAAAAGWLREGVELTDPLPISLKPLESQAQLNKWASDATQGRVSEFPLEIEDGPGAATAVVLASALFAETTWKLSTNKNGSLRVSSGEFAVVDTAAAGLVAVTAPQSDALDVLSVIAAPDVPQAAVWTAADEVLDLRQRGLFDARRIPASELTNGHSWKVTDKLLEMSSGQPDEVWSASVPAWKADVKIDLGSTPGVDEVGSTLIDLVNMFPAEVQAAQSAMAEYSDTGFVGAAVTAIQVIVTGIPQYEMRMVRTVKLNYAHPHAVVAVGREGAWDGIPLFHCWVDETLTETVSAARK